MTFLALLGPIAVTIAVLAGIGGLLTWSIGLRGLWAVSLAPAFALTIIACTAVVAPWVGLRWSLVPVAIVTAIVGGLILIIRRATGGASTDRRPRRRQDWWLVGSLVAAGIVLTVRVLQIVQGPEQISQTFDNIFHLNGIRYVLDGGNASSLRLGYMTTPDGGLPFYPAAWHGLVSLVVQLSGASIPAAVNAVVLTTCALVWPLAIVLLVRALFGRTRAITVAAAVIATAIPAFPILLMDYGVLYPYQLGLALLPVALAVTLRLLALIPRRDPLGAGWWVLILVGVIPGLTLAHPGAFVAWLALTAPMALVFGWRSFRASGSARRRWVVGLAFLAYLAVGVLIVRVLRPPIEARQWPTQMTVPDALWQALSVSMWYQLPAVLVAVATALGLVWAIVDRSRSVLIALGMYVVALTLFVTVAALPLPSVRDALTGSWYNNLPRLAAILAIAMVPIGAYGLGRSWTALSARTWVRRTLVRLPRKAGTAVGIVTALALALALQGPAIERSVAWAKPLYRLDQDSPLLSIDEYRLIERLPQHVPAGTMIAGSPYTGTSLAYALADRTVLMPHALMQVTADIEAVNDGLDSAEAESRACRATQELGIGYVLDFGPKEVHPGEHPFPGLDGLAASPAVRLIDSEGEARLYKVVACD